MCLPAGDVTDPRVRPGGSCVTAVVTRQDGDRSRNSLVMWDLATGTERVLLADPEPAAGRGLSGGVHDWHPDGGSVVVILRGGGAVRVEVVTGGCGPLPLDPARSWSTPVHSPDGGSVAVVADWCELVVVTGGTARTVHRVEDGHLMDAAWNGSTPTAHWWERPEMAWTSSRILGGPVGPGVAVQQPRGGSGRFGWIDDENGTWNVRVDGETIVDDCEHGGPTWGPGQRTWCLDDSGTRLAHVRNESGFGSLWIADLRTGERHLVGRAPHGCLSWHGGTLAAVRSGARTPQELVVYDVSEPAAVRKVLTVSPQRDRWFPGFDDELVEPSVQQADGIPWRLYGPVAPRGGLIVWVHGGPTDQWQVTFRPRFAFWSSRGWAIAVVDHRGSTGHGRGFRLALEGEWGSADADDTATVARSAQRMLGVPPSRTVLMGASAGGLSVLSAANRHADLAACVVTAYPVVDLDLLLQGDDPFEGHYNHVLVGDVSVSPCMDVRHLRDVPVLTFHGDMDELVVPEHSRRLHAAVERAGGEVRVVLMPGEGHGFRDPASTLRELAMTQAFLEECTGL